MKLHFRAPVGTAHRGDREAGAAGRGGDPQGHPGRQELDQHQRHGRRADVLQPRFRSDRQHQRHGCRDPDLAQDSRTGRSRSTCARSASKVPPKFPGSTFYFQSADIVTQVLNFGLPAPIDVQVQDFNFERGQRYAGAVRKAIEEVPGAVDVRQMQVLNYPALRVEVDRLRAARLGLHAARRRQQRAHHACRRARMVNPSYFLASQRRQLHGRRCKRRSRRSLARWTI